MTHFRPAPKSVPVFHRGRIVRQQQLSGNVIVKAWRKNRDILGNAGSLYGTVVVTSALGFVFWALAARLFNPRAVGFGSAAISAMTMLSTIGMFGLNTLLVGELPQRKSKAGLISAALVTAGVGSLLLGLGFALVAPIFSRNFVGISSPGHLGLFVSGVGIIGMTLVLDDATIGLMRGHLQLWRNFFWALSKLLMLPVAALFLHDKFGTGIVASWVAGATLSTCILAIKFLMDRQPVLHKPDWDVLRRLGGLTVIHNWLNLAYVVPWLALPVLVTITVGAYANAAFYAAWMVSNFLRLVPICLSTVLFAVAAGDVRALLPKLRFSLRMSMLIGIPGIAVLCLAAPIVLGFFGASYVKTGTVSLILLNLGYLPSVPKVHYIAVCRATGQLKRAAIVLTCTACLVMAAAFCGGKMGGLTGLGIGVLAASTFEGLITAPRVIRAAAMRPASRHQRGSAPPERARNPGFHYRAVPGSRLLHAAVGDSASKLSTLDRAQYTPFRLITGSAGEAWADAAATVAKDLQVPLETVIIGPSREVTDTYHGWARVHQIEEDGALLIRPDRHIGWRSMTMPGNPEQALREALTNLLSLLFNPWCLGCPELLVLPGVAW